MGRSDMRDRHRIEPRPGFRSVQSGLRAGADREESELAARDLVALADPATRSRLANGGFEPFPAERQTPETLAALQKADAARWWPIIKELGLKPE